MNDVRQSYDALGYNLHEVTENEWILDVQGGNLHADTFKNIVKLMVNMGFQLSEVEFAVNEMLKHNHNTANFGMRKSFIMTFQKDWKNEKAS